MACVWRRLSGKFRGSLTCAPAVLSLLPLLSVEAATGSVLPRCVRLSDGSAGSTKAVIAGHGLGDSWRSMSTLNLRSLLPSDESGGGKAKRKITPLRNRRFIDKLFVRARGGDGGNGCTSFRKSRQARHGVADGGNGGKGGDVWVEATSSLWDLASVKQHVNGGRGGNGMSKKKVGQRGEDKVIRVPLGTVVRLIRGEWLREEESQPAVEALSEVADEMWGSECTSLHDDQGKSAMPQEPFGKGVGGGDDEGECDGRSKVDAMTSAFRIDPNEETIRCDEDGSERVEQYEEETDDKCSGDGRGVQAISSDGTAISGGQRHLEGDGRGREQMMAEVEDCAVFEEEDELGTQDREEASYGRRTLRGRKMEVVIGDLTSPGQRIVVGMGGQGGRGNAAMARGRRQQTQNDSNVQHEKGAEGSSAELILELKSIADVGLVGLPNAGKSTLLGALTLAQPRIGSYAFTTLRPHIASVKFIDFFSFTIADLPGLIEGAHENRGLGFEFLRHVERTRLLVYVLDLSSGFGDNKGPRPWDQLNSLVEELELFEKGLSKRPSLVVGSKIDEAGAAEALVELRRRTSLPVFPVCAVLGEGIDELREALRRLVLSEISEYQGKNAVDAY